MPQKSPLARVKEQFGSKDKLVDQIVTLLPPTDEPKDEIRKRLLGAANTKLLRLHSVASTVKKDHGSRDKLITAAAESLGRAKDKDYVEKLGTFPIAKLLDLVTAGKARAAAKAASAAARKPRAAKKAATEKRA